MFSRALFALVCLGLLSTVLAGVVGAAKRTTITPRPTTRTTRIPGSAMCKKRVYGCIARSIQIQSPKYDDPAAPQSTKDTICNGYKSISGCISSALNENKGYCKKNLHSNDKAKFNQLDGIYSYLCRSSPKRDFHDSGALKSIKSEPDVCDEKLDTCIEKLVEERPPTEDDVVSSEALLCYAYKIVSECTREVLIGNNNYCYEQLDYSEKIYLSVLDAMFSAECNSTQHKNLDSSEESDESEVSVEPDKPDI